MSDENFKFTPGPEPKFPRLIMRAFVSPDQFVEWNFTPPPEGKRYVVHFTVMQDVNEILHIDFMPETMQPIE